MAYFVLFMAGLAEVVWAVGLKYAEGFSKLLPSVLTVIGFVLSLWLLSLALKSIPLGTAYAIWTGIGALGAFIAGILLFGEVASVARIVSALLILVGLIGLKLSS